MPSARTHAGVNATIAEGRTELERKVGRYGPALALGRPIVGLNGGTGQSMIGELAVAWATSSPHFADDTRPFRAQVLG